MKSWNKIISIHSFICWIYIPSWMQEVSNLPSWVLETYEKLKTQRLSSILVKWMGCIVYYNHRQNRWVTFSTFLHFTRILSKKKIENKMVGRNLNRIADRAFKQINDFHYLKKNAHISHFDYFVNFWHQNFY